MIVDMSNFACAYQFEFQAKWKYLKFTKWVSDFTAGLLFKGTVPRLAPRLNIQCARFG